MESVVIEKIHDIIFQHAPLSADVGLLNGKTGIALYAYRASKMYGNKSLHELAGKMIDDVLVHLANSQMSDNGFLNGLAGIVYGFEYLAREKFIDLQGVNVFRNLDDRIFEEIITNENIPIGLHGIVGYLLYLYPKIAFGGSDLESYRYNKRLVIELVNNLSLQMDKTEKHFSEPLSFNFLWDLPLLLISLGKISELHIYDRKIFRIIEQQLTAYVLSFFPKLHCNRLYLLLGMKSLSNLSIAGWEEHISLLEHNISMDTIIHEELKTNAIALINGISGISLICDRISAIDANNKFNIKSEEMERKMKETFLLSFHTTNKTSILSGYTGMGYALLK